MPKAKPLPMQFNELPFDTQVIEGAYKSAAELNEKLAATALDAAAASQDLSKAWTKDALGKLADLAKAQAEPADYFKTLTDVMTAQSEIALKNMTAFADVAKTYQAETMEVLTSAGKDLNADTANSVKAATSKAADAAKKVAAAA